MEQLLTRFNGLSVGLLPLSNGSPSSQNIIDELISYYKAFQLYDDFGSESINYLCGLATRYAYATLCINDEGALRAYALWLSFIWLIDGFFDKYKSLTSQADVENLINIFLLEPIDQPNHPLFEVIISLYDRYLDLIAPYCMDGLHAFSEITGWLLKYLDTLIVPIPERKGLRKNNSEGSSRLIFDQTYSISEYTNWRLDSGAMMCVVWHLILFNHLSIKSDTFEYFFELCALIVSFHNDIVSYRRDLQQMTPNLVSIARQSNDDDFMAMNRAITITDNLYSEITIEFLRLNQKYKDTKVSSLVLDILEGSYNWTYLEPRYSVGIKMLHAVKENNKKQFYLLLFDVDNTPGDPQKKIQKSRNSGKKD